MTPKQEHTQGKHNTNGLFFYSFMGYQINIPNKQYTTLTDFLTPVYECFGLN